MSVALTVLRHYKTCSVSHLIIHSSLFQKVSMYVTGKTKNIKFTDHVDTFSLKLDTCENRFKYLKAAVEAELGLGGPTSAFNFAAKYPFKIGTAKVLVGVVSTTQTSAFSVSVSITVICNINCIFLCFMVSVKCLTSCKAMIMSKRINVELNMTIMCSLLFLVTLILVLVTTTIATITATATSSATTVTTTTTTTTNNNNNATSITTITSGSSNLARSGVQTFT